MPTDAERNRIGWDAASDAYQEQHRTQLERTPEGWGVWSIPESELRLLGNVSGRDVLEYGCGAAAWSIALARRGARVTGLDNSARQLEHARRAIEAAGATVTLVHASGENTPFADASFDVVFCDHGAMSFASPDRTIPEVARVLRSGGVFAFNVEHPMHALAWDDATQTVSRRFASPYFGLDRFDDPSDGIVNFSRPISEYWRLLASNGFAVERLIEPRPAADRATTYGEFAPLAWARDFPAELLVAARKR